MTMLTTGSATAFNPCTEEREDNMSTTEKKLIIAPPEERTLHLTLAGTTGLVMHNFGEKARRQIAETQGDGAKKPRGARDPEAEYEASYYRLEDDSFGFPCAGFKKCAIRGAKMVDGISMTDARQMFFVLPDGRDKTSQMDCVRIKGDPIERTDVVRLKNGSADLRYRPEITNWSTTLRISYDSALISPEQIANLFYRAGYSVGVGDWRPEKDGDFGRFTVSEGVVVDVGHELDRAA